jgi:hypothetical protein
MTIYGLDDSFTIERQVGHTLCWASAAKAIAGNMGIAHATVEGLAKENEDKKDGNDVRKLLENRYQISNTVLFNWKKDGTDLTTREKIVDLEANLKQHLQGPLLCGLTAANFERTDGKFYAHATLIYQYNDQTREVKIADPARDNNAKFTVPVMDLVLGFHYMFKNELGPNSSSMIQSDQEFMMAKIYSLTKFYK